MASLQMRVPSLIAQRACSTARLSTGEPTAAGWSTRSSHRILEIGKFGNSGTGKYGDSIPILAGDADARIASALPNLDAARRPKHSQAFTDEIISRLQNT